MTKAATAERHENPVEGPPPIVMIPINELYLASEAPKGVNLTVRDSSSGSPLTDAELKASIYAKGIIQPLIFKTYDDGKNYVIAGNRRLRFLREIFADALASQVQTQDVDQFEGDWREIAMDTNLSLPPHLVERYELIVTLAKDLKQSPEETCTRYGMTQQQYRRVMALGKMSKKVREAWRSGEIDAKTAQAFTLEPDPKEQDRIFELCKKHGHNGRVESFAVRRRIIPENQAESGRLVAFIGIEACKKAKIIKQEDLFATDHIVTDLKAVKKLAGDKLAERCKQLVADGGWQWAVREDQIEGNAYAYGTLQPINKVQPTAVEANRLDELKAALSEISNGQTSQAAEDDLIEEQDKISEDIKSRGFTDAQKKKSGCFLKIAHNGSLSIEYGKVKPEARRSVESTERAPTVASKARAKAKKSGEVVLTNALAERLSEQLQKAGAEALKMDHAVATSAVIAAISSGGHILKIHVGGPGAKKSSSFDAVFDAALKSTPQQREAMFGQIAAQALSIIVHNGIAKMPLEDDGISDLFEAMNGARVVKAIADQFDAKDYFSSVGADAIVQAVQCSMGDDHAAKVAKMKKPDAAKFATANVPAKGWLPKQLRTAWYTGPEEDNEKPAPKPKVKAKPAKKTAKKAAKKKSKK